MSTSRWLTWTPGALIIENNPEPELTELTKPTSVSFVSPTPAPFPIIEPTVQSVVKRPAFVFPHCPRCASYALYRRNDVGSYECETCGLQTISEDVARRTQ